VRKENSTNKGRISGVSRTKKLLKKGKGEKNLFRLETRGNNPGWKKTSKNLPKGKALLKKKEQYKLILPRKIGEGKYGRGGLP